MQPALCVLYTVGQQNGATSFYGL